MISTGDVAVNHHFHWHLFEETVQFAVSLELLLFVVESTSRKKNSQLNWFPFHRDVGWERTDYSKISQWFPAMDRNLVPHWPNGTHSAQTTRTEDTPHSATPSFPAWYRLKNCRFTPLTPQNDLNDSKTDLIIADTVGCATTATATDWMRIQKLELLIKVYSVIWVNIISLFRQIQQFHDHLSWFQFWIYLSTAARQQRKNELFRLCLARTTARARVFVCLSDFLLHSIRFGVPVMCSSASS